MKRKKIWAAVMAAIMLAAAVTGCGGGSEEGAKGEASKDGVTLALYGNADDAAKPYMQKIFELYEEETGNKIDVQGLDASNFESVCLTKFQTGDIPDVLMHFGGYSLDAYNPAENFVDFTDAEWVDDIADTSVAQTMRDGV
ncbi:carbohydrate ABC transporter substrate-binding protein, partial [Clostridioides difficile]|nr:carbohydrate ABC transporter substrate-binding protein [Clostridioides difficile]